MAPFWGADAKSGGLRGSRCCAVVTFYGWRSWRTMLQQEPLGGEPSGNIPSQPVFAARLKPQCLAMTSLTQSAWNKRTMHSGLEEFSLFECIIVLIGQWTPCKIMEKPLWKVWNTFLLPALAQIIADFISKCSWGFECSACFRRNHPCVNDFLLIPILALLHISWYELIPRRWARISVFLGKKMFQVTSIPLATSTVVEHNEEVCLKEPSARPGLSWGKDTHGSSPGVNSPSGVQDCSASPLRNGLPQPTKSHCVKPSKSSWVGIKWVNKEPVTHQAVSSVLTLSWRDLGSLDSWICLCSTTKYTKKVSKSRLNGDLSQELVLILFFFPFL